MLLKRRKFNCKTVVFILCLFSLILHSCELLDIPDYSRYPKGTRKFWARNFSSNKYYEITADLLAEGAHCNIWVERGCGVDKVTAQIIAGEYDNKVYPKMINAFGFEDDYGLNTMEWADLYGNNDGKLCILLLDIKDSYKKGVNDSYVAGYFWAADLYENIPHNQYYRYSNECDMIYVDTNPGKPNSPESYKTIAHEMQHLMNYITSAVKRNNGSQYVNQMDIWVDEGLSSAAEWVYCGEHGEERVKSYNSSSMGLTNLGNNFFVWGNRENESQYAILDDYDTVYFFFQWLRLQSGTVNIYKDIIFSQYGDYRAVTNAFGYNDSWDALLKTWLAANYINASSGLYGYKDELVLKDIKAPYVPSEEETISLYPGEGVYSIATSFPVPASSGNIRYAGLVKDVPGNLVDSGSFSNGALLTYNVNTVKSGNGIIETGTITGVTPPAETGAAAAFAGSRAAQGGSRGPFPISAADMLGQSGHESGFFPGTVKFLKGSAGNEIAPE